MSNIAEQLGFFAKNGYLLVPDALTLTEVELANATIDQDLAENETLWRHRPNGRSQSVNILLAQPNLDFTMRPTSVLPLMESIMGPAICADEHSVMIREANPTGPTECVWHRDSCGGGIKPPYFTRYLSIVFYLTDVDETTHTFSVVPGSAQTSQPKGIDEYDLTKAHHIEGTAGTAILFNAYTIHAGNVRNTTSERRTIHLYCGHTTDRFVSNFTIFPRRLWENKDDATKKYYSRLNPISQLIADRF